MEGLASRNTIRAGTHAMMYATKTSDRIRAITTDLRGQSQKHDWEATCVRGIHTVWLADGQSLHEFSFYLPSGG